ncbi:formate dehydrogenase subunit gamma [Deferribacteraceae bacterium V6Fe1]|nr:formate dehydrogenase subunit gamma [Deferribacteraceae bacterium V6Fe1]
MRRILFVTLIMFLLLMAAVYSAENDTVQPIFSSSKYNSIENYKIITEHFTGEWQKYGEPFTILQKEYVRKIYFWILIAIPGIFVLHYLVIGPKKFPHEGNKYLVFTVFNRAVHWLTAISFLTLTVSGLIMIFGKYFGGGGLVRTFRYIHFPSAVIFVPLGLVMLLMWLREMIIAPGDITWFFKFGGYLSKKTENIMPVGKFNPGQKSWFWLGTLGGFVMAYTGYYMYSFAASTDNLRIYAIIHNFLGMAMLIMFLVHLYMSLFAIKGSLKSMLTGYKYEDEIRIMHCRFYSKLSGKDCSK